MTRRGGAAEDPAEAPLEDPRAEEIAVYLGDLLAARGMTVTDLAQRVGITLANMSVLKNGHARAIRFSTLAGICQALDCQPGDLLRWEPPGA